MKNHTCQCIRYIFFPTNVVFLLTLRQGFTATDIQNIKVTDLQSKRYLSIFGAFLREMKHVLYNDKYDTYCGINIAYDKEQSNMHEYIL